MKRNLLWIFTCFAALALPGFPASTVTVTGAENRSRLSPLERQVRAELITLPFYGVFDYLEFEVRGGQVILRGEVSRPTLHSSAVQLVRRLPGVTEVVDEIQLLPLSPMDNGIRTRLLRAIYGDDVLNRYGAGPNPWIRLIVDNGHITLEGYVDRPTDKDIAFLRANAVPGAFSVTNNLKVRPS